MPLAVEAPEPTAGITVDVSAVVDLYVWVSKCGHGPALDELVEDRALVRRVTGFWEEDSTTQMAFDELPILAALGGYLPGETVADFLAALPELAARPPGPLGLRTEQEETRELVLRHLRVLREAPHRLAEYVDLLREVAAAVRERWLESVPSLRARASWFRARLSEGEDLPSLLPPRHIALLPRYRGFLDEALRRNTVMLVPNLGSDIIYDLPGVFLVGVGLKDESPAELARRRTAKVAERLRALSDPTRLAIAAYLGTHPDSVSGLARAFSLSQPTVSAHVRSLRSAGLLDSRRVHGMTEFRLAQGRLASLFQDAQEALSGDHG